MEGVAVARAAAELQALDDGKYVGGNIQGLRTLGYSRKQVQGDS
jgi:hypothetical protein